MANFISEQKDWATVNGSSIIIHRFRCRLNLTMIEYAVMDFLHTAFSKHKSYDIDDLKRKLGMNKDHFEKVVTALQEKEMIHGTLYSLIPTEKWLSLFGSLESDFEELWEIFMKHGNKPDSKARYMIVRKTVSKEHLHRRAKIYIDGVIKHSKNIDYAKGCQVWLNSKKAHWDDLAPGETKDVMHKKTESTYQGNFYGKEKSKGS